MNEKTRHPSKAYEKTRPSQGRQAPPNPLRQADNRWQRTVRYGWDKGGSSGGRK